MTADSPAPATARRIANTTMVGPRLSAFSNLGDFPVCFGLFMRSSLMEIVKQPVKASSFIHPVDRNSPEGRSFPRLFGELFSKKSVLNRHALSQRPVSNLEEIDLGGLAYENGLFERRPIVPVVVGRQPVLYAIRRREQAKGPVSRYGFPGSPGRVLRRPREEAKGIRRYREYRDAGSAGRLLGIRARPWSLGSFSGRQGP